MNTQDVLYLRAKDYPGGIAALAARMGRSASTLQKELRGAPGYKLGVTEAETVDDFLEGQPALANRARNCGYMLLPLPEVEHAGDCVLSAIGQVARELGDYMTAVSETLSDGTVSDNELQRCQRELGEMIQRAQHVQALLAARNAAGKPAHERRQAVRRAADRGAA